MPTYIFKYHCEKCEKEFTLNVNADSEWDDEGQKELERQAKSHFELMHDNAEHTFCHQCGKKIDGKTAEIKIIGRQDPNEKESRKGVAFTFLFAPFCKECYKNDYEHKIL